jgi:hypothetical protein
MIDLNRQYDYSNRFDIKHKKKQIILCNTTSYLEQHIIKLNTRYNGKYDRVPHYTISLDGTIYEHVQPEYVTKFITFDSVDNQAIIITLENVGWLNYTIKQTEFFDWTGEPYLGEVVNRIWKNKKFWAAYKKEQIVALSHLLNYLCNRCSIEKQFTGNNVTITKPRNFKGVLNRSNYNKNYYDLSPAMDFEYITNNLM